MTTPGGCGNWVILAVDRRTLGAPVRAVAGLRRVVVPLDPGSETTREGDAVALTARPRLMLRFASEGDARDWLRARVEIPRPRWRLVVSALAPAGAERR